MSETIYKNRLNLGANVPLLGSNVWAAIIHKISWQCKKWKNVIDRKLEQEGDTQENKEWGLG
jgi:hypothetical protein